MELDFQAIEYLKNPDQMLLKGDFQQFLLSLDVPTIIDISGKNVDKTRVITTLLHGNEPSGFIAMHRWLTGDSLIHKPETNLRFIIVSIEAATSTPLLSTRYLANGIDINRCFGSSLNHGYYQRANLIEQAIKAVSPEVVIDIHNTPSDCPSFAVTPLVSNEGLTASSFFSDTLVLSGISRGALMEQNFGCPVITIECGGSQDEQAHAVAFQGISELASCSNLSNYHQKNNVKIFYKPLCLMVNTDVDLHFSQHDEGYSGVTFINKIEQLNYGGVKEGQLLGWLDEHGLDNLMLINDVGDNVIDKYFAVRDNRLVSLSCFKVFMATNNVNIAKNDCLFYMVNMPNS
ncbi:succinylglutamate desuccinylase/aspartoacylase family protein [Thalassotalea sp. 1_MG-2023]|uniref:succinylglutamate desuccinylase/aspartoacylase domain-containing protein n=1 Tax=Thalassotalea sp. 1_MG-2023 TaxID=3062680 RepID=UPI0026E115D9|nr:succinylglutamate desuccinylase/aspartoacylase family protein [Thalassotalea sp. 1_MG-2023]MDO6428723.1 succinylglutamate desuccinylase/aspartoacylase family protein [Thalassotalea sp. 1_MG-2023]